MTNKFIIVEGQDNCGKSTLLRKLRSMIDNPKIITLSSSGPPKNTGQEWNITHYSNVLYSMSNFVKNEGFDVLADRLHIGETVYGPLFRGTNSEYIWELEKEIYDSLQDQIYLLVLTDNGFAISDRDDGCSIEISPSEFDETGDLFLEGFHKSSIKNKMLINISCHGWPNAEKIYNWIYSPGE